MEEIPPEDPLGTPVYEVGVQVNSRAMVIISSLTVVET